MAFGSFGSRSDTETEKLLKELQAYEAFTNQAQSTLQQNTNAINSASSLGQTISTTSGTSWANAVYTPTGVVGSALKSKLFNRTQQTASPKREREVSVSSVIRGINGLLYKIGEMKGQH